jgi:hypothetical protein
MIKTKKSTEKKKKERGKRWKAKPIIDIKSISKEEKEKLAEEIISQFHKKKRKEKKTKKKVGAPPKIKATELRDLKVCFALWMSVEKACYLTKIGVSTYYDFLKKHPEFSEEKEFLKDNISDQSLLLIWSIIRKKSANFLEMIKSWEYAKWRLTKKHPEFGDKLRLTWSISLLELHKKLQEENKKDEET